MEMRVADMEQVRLRERVRELEKTVMALCRAVAQLGDDEGLPAIDTRELRTLAKDIEFRLLGDT